MSLSSPPSAPQREGWPFLFGVLVVLSVGWLALVALVTYQAGVPRSDFARFYYSTLQYQHGDDMYAWTPAVPAVMHPSTTLDREEHRIDLLNLNPPHFHVLLLPFTSLPLQSAYAVWLVLSCLCLLHTLRLLSESLGAAWTARQRQILLLVLGSASSTIMIQFGQIGWLLLLPTTLMWRAARAGAWERCGLYLGLLLSLKLFYLLFVPYLLLQRRWRALGCAVLSGAVSVGVGMLLFGIDNYRSWLASLHSADSWAWLEMNASLTGLLTRSLQANPLFATVASWPEADVRVLALGGSAVLGMLTLLGSWWRPALDRDFALLLTATVLLSPLGWLYYFVLPLGPALAWWLHRLPLARWQIVVALLILPGWFCQSWWLLSYQPSALATVTLGSMYFWSVAALWLLLVLDGFAVGTYNKP